MYKIKCFLDNIFNKDIEGIKKRLSELGYDDCSSNVIATSEVKRYIVCDNGQFYVTGFKPSNEFIDCGVNTPLFMALAGYREDTDKNQWFVADLGDIFDKESIAMVMSLNDKFDMTAPGMYHRATIEEIIREFNKRD